jgi:hypothetical protein
LAAFDILTGKRLGSLSLAKHFGPLRPERNERLVVADAGPGKEALVLLESNEGEFWWRPKTDPEEENACARQYQSDPPRFIPCLGIAGRFLLRSGRLLFVQPQRIVEIDLGTGKEGRTWPILDDWNPGQARIQAVDLVDGRLVVLFHSETGAAYGHILAFVRSGDPTVAVPPEIERGVDSLSDGVLVVRHGINPLKGLTDRTLALAGYSAVEFQIPTPLPDLERVRTLLLDRTWRAGDTCSVCEQEFERCNLCKGSFERTVAPALGRISNWDSHAVALLSERNDDLQRVVMMAGVFLNSPAIARALLRRIDALPIDRDTVERDPRYSPDERTRWFLDAENAEHIRLRAIQSLVKMDFAEAIPKLGSILPELRLRNPLPHGDRVSPAVCGMLARSSLPEAKVALEAYDRAIGVPGAWRTLCEENHP